MNTCICIDRGLVKGHTPLKECPPSTFGPISCVYIYTFLVFTCMLLYKLYISDDTCFAQNQEHKQVTKERLHHIPTLLSSVRNYTFCVLVMLMIN